MVVLEEEEEEEEEERLHNSIVKLTSRKNWVLWSVLTARDLAKKSSQCWLKRPMCF